MNKPFTPSSYLLLNMIASAEAKFEASRDRARLREEARLEAREIRAERRKVAGRLYAFIQGVQ